MVKFVFSIDAGLQQDWWWSLLFSLLSRPAKIQNSWIDAHKSTVENVEHHFTWWPLIWKSDVQLSMWSEWKTLFLAFLENLSSVLYHFLTFFKKSQSITNGDLQGIDANSGFEEEWQFRQILPRLLDFTRTRENAAWFLLLLDFGQSSYEFISHVTAWLINLKSAALRQWCTLTSFLFQKLFWMFLAKLQMIFSRLEFAPLIYGFDLLMMSRIRHSL